MPERDHTAVGGEARQLWEKGYDCVEKKNYDYAMELLCMALEQDPSFFECRMALRAAQMKKHENAGRLAKMAAATTTAHHFMQAKLALSKKNNFGALVHAEKILCADPENSSGHRVIVDASKSLDYPQTLISSLQLLKRVNPDDIYLQQAYRDTAAKATIYRGGYEKVMEGGEEDKEVMPSDFTSEDVLEEKIYHMEEKLQDEPDNHKLAVDIARLYVERQDFERAFEYFDWVMENNPVGDSAMDKAVAEAHEARFEFDLHTLDAEDPNEAAEHARLIEERDAFMLENCRERADRYPTMLEFRFELGEWLFRAGDVNEAIHAFQRAQNSPGHRLRSLSYLGQCFLQRGMHDMAVSMFEKGLQEKSAMDDQKKEMVYHLGCVYEEIGKMAEAMEQFKSIYEVDIGYRDVATKVESGYM
ncbi:tetratricopeptide repeat protein [Verrucomicrobia bacterium]|nr:tetratricopeptide repeat protein [Verrucomicrobiota bacterium]